MTKKLIKSLALGAFAIGGGITTLASTSCSSSSGPTETYTISYNSYSYINTGGMSDGQLNQQTTSPHAFSVTSSEGTELSYSDFKIIIENDPECTGWDGSVALYNLSFSSDWKLIYWVSTLKKSSTCTFFLKCQNTKTHICSNSLKLKILFSC